MSLLNASGVDLVITLCVRLLIIFAILPVHEYAHAYVAKKLGDNTALIAGRLTLNPLAHVDPIGALMLILLGFGWAKPVPVNPRNFKNYRRDNALVSLAGPVSNFICAFIGVFVGRVILNLFDITARSLAYEPGIPEFAYIAVYNFSIINLSLAIFNLLPIRPLDGSNILAYFLPPKVNAFLYKYTNIIQIVLFVLIFLGFLSGPLSWLIDKIYTLFTYLFIWVDIIFRHI